ncbi:MAG: acylphosphatase [Bryobacteraceae bacterium]
MSVVAKRYFICGRVQGVGFRQFVKMRAEKLNMRGYTRNLDDGSVEVYAIGTDEQHNDLAGYLRTGPPWSNVRGVEQEDTELFRLAGFEIEV